MATSPPKIVQFSFSNQTAKKPKTAQHYLLAVPFYRVEGSGPVPNLFAQNFRGNFDSTVLLFQEFNRN